MPTYKDCNVLCRLKRKETPLVTTVEIDEFTDMVKKNFDYDFNGESSVYPFELPELPEEYGILVIVGASGSGKSTLLKEFVGYSKGNDKEFNNNAIVSNFETPRDASERLSAVGLNSMPVWCKPRRVLSVGEGFRADLALNIKSYVVFDEFTSTIDRNVAKSTCKGLSRLIDAKSFNHVVLCSCHKDFISFLNPDLVIDLDEEKLYDCRGVDLGEALPCKSTSHTTKTCGVYLGSITI